MNQYLTVQDVARICQVHEMTVRRHINEGRLKAVRVGKGVRVRKEELEAYLQPEQPQPERAKRQRGRPPKPITADDPIFRLLGIVSNEDAANLSENKYAAFGEAYSPKP